MLIVSENEVFKPSNTGRLIADTIQETYVYQWNRTEPSEEMLALLQDDSYQPVIVFPADYVDDPSRLIEDLEPGRLVKEDVENKKLLLIFIDGSWREARKIFRRSDFLNLCLCFPLSRNLCLNTSCAAPRMISIFQPPKSRH